MRAGGIVPYLEAVVGFANSYFAVSSWSLLELSPTVAEPVHLSGVTSSNCGSHDHLGWSGLGDAIDAKAYAAACSAQGHCISNFDFRMVVIPRCTGYGFSGIGWVGAPGFLLNMYYGSGLDPSFIHEFGHNLGINHGTIQ